MKKLLALLLLYNSANAQLQHSVMLDYTAAHFWDAKARGSLRLTELYHWYLPPGTINYFVFKDKWGLNAGLDGYLTYYTGSEFISPKTASRFNSLYSRQYLAINLNALRSVIGNAERGVHATVGLTSHLGSHTIYIFKPDPSEWVGKRLDNGSPLFGFNVGFIARYRVWKGFTIQATASHTKLFGGTDFSNISNLRLGYGYTFGGGMNRAPKRQRAPY